MQTDNRNKLMTQLSNAELIQHKIESTAQTVQSAEFMKNANGYMTAAKNAIDVDKLHDLRMDMEDNLSQLNEASDILNTEFDMGIDETMVDDELNKLDEEFGVANQQTAQQQYNTQQMMDIPTNINLPTVPQTIPTNYVSDMPSVPSNRVTQPTTTTAATNQRVPVAIGGDADMMALLNGLENA